MGTAVANNTAEIVRVDGYTQDQVILIRDTVAKGCTMQELQLFLTIARNKQLDPLTQIRPIKRWDSKLGREAMVIQTGIDGYRVIAARTGQHMGTDDAIFDTEDDEHPGKASVTVYRQVQGEKVAFTASTRWEEYVQVYKEKDSGQWVTGTMWKKMPYLMLSKVAETLALRKAFPDEMSGVYTNEEMGQAENPSDAPVQQRTPRRPPVEDPRRASETQVKPQPDEFGGTIQESKLTPGGSMWVYLEGGVLVRVDATKIDADMKKAGSRIQFKGQKMKHPKVGPFIELHALVELTPPEAELVFPDEEVTSKTNNAEVDEMIAAGKLKPASEVEPPPQKKGTIGPRREQRLYAIMTQSKAANGGMTKDDVKHILSSLPVPLEHLRDLDISMESQFEEWMNGTEDWKAFLNDSD